MAIQVLPESKNIHPYEIVDKANEVIQNSGVKYRVCPFETVIETDLDTALNLVKKINTKLKSGGAEKSMIYIKIQNDYINPVTIEEKMSKYN